MKASIGKLNIYVSNDENFSVSSQETTGSQNNVEGSKVWRSCEFVERGIEKRRYFLCGKPHQLFRCQNEMTKLGLKCKDPNEVS